jgi:hypothetical protein
VGGGGVAPLFAEDVLEAALVARERLSQQRPSVSA